MSTATSFGLPMRWRPDAPTLAQSHRLQRIDVPSSPRTVPRLIAVVLMLAAIVPAAAHATGFATMPEPYSARYEGRHRIGPVSAAARVEARLERQGDLARYTMDIEVRLLGLRRRLQDCSLLRRDAAGWSAAEYRHTDHGDKALSLHTRFANGAGGGGEAKRDTVTTFGDARAPATVSVDGRAWDPLSFQLLLAAWAVQAAAAPAAASAGTAGTTATTATAETTEVRVVERGTLKRHRVGAATALAFDLRGQAETGREIVSRKENGDTIQLLMVSRGGRWMPGRIVVDGVTMELAASAPAAPPADTSAAGVTMPAGEPAAGCPPP